MHAQERKKSIIETTIQIISERGIQGTTTARIAAAEGISEKALYIHFASRRDILVAALDSVFERATSILRESEGANALEYLRACAELHWPSEKEFVLPLYEFLASSPQEDLRGELRKRHQADMEFVASILEEGKTQGVIRRDLDSQLGAWKFWAVCWAEDIAFMLGFDDFGPGGQSERMIEDFLQSISA
jgi:AcrR family transcriptional regulator